MAALVDFNVAQLQSLLRQWGCNPRHAGPLLMAFYHSAGRLDPATLALGRRLLDRLVAGTLQGCGGTFFPSSPCTQGEDRGGGSESSVELFQREDRLTNWPPPLPSPGVPGEGEREHPRAQSPQALPYHDELHIMGTRIVAEHRSADQTVKLLVGLTDGQAVEAVLMPAFRPDRAAACISSQIGCAMGCDFCASARGGLQRNLWTGEIVEQFLHLKACAAALGRRLASLVFMGMGEPLLNLPNVLPAIERIADPAMGNLGWRHITVSTVGIVPGIDALAQIPKPVHLALSLHAPDDATRSGIVPANRRWPVAAVMDAARRFQARTGRIVNIEYCLLAGVNDSDAQAHLLAALMKNFRAHVNLIPHNWIGSGISGVEYRRPSPQRVQRFMEILRTAGVVAHLRVARGDDVSAACGQLQRKIAAAAPVQ